MYFFSINCWSVCLPVFYWAYTEEVCQYFPELAWDVLQGQFAVAVVLVLEAQWLCAGRPGLGFSRPAAQTRSIDSLRPVDWEGWWEPSPKTQESWVKIETPLCKRWHPKKCGIVVDRGVDYMIIPS